MISLFDASHVAMAAVPGSVFGGNTPGSGASSSGGGASCSTCVAHRPTPDVEGNLQVDPEIHLPSPGMDVDIAYYSNSNSPYNGPFGYGRTLSTNLTAQAAGSPAQVSLQRGDGSVAVYKDNGSGTFVPQNNWVFNTLVQDSGNGLWKETTLDGVTTAYPLDTTGQITSVTYVEDAVGNRHTFLYASDGTLETLQDAVGRRVSFAYDSSSGSPLLESIQDWAGRRTTFAYDTSSFPGQPVMTTVIGPTGCVTGYGYDFAPTSLNPPQPPPPVLTRITNPNGYATTYAYDSTNRVSQKTVATAGTDLYSYESGQMMVVAPLTAPVVNTLDADLNIIAQTNGLGETVSYTYNARGQVTSVETMLGAVTTTLYDGLGNTVGMIDPLGHQTTMLRDVFNNLTTTIYADGSTWENLYGYAGSPFDTSGAKRRLQVSVDPLGNRTSYAYDGHGQLVSQQNALGFVTTYNYDGLGNRIASVDALGNVSTMVYDVAGNVVAAINPLGYRTSIAYDAQNRPLQVTDARGAITTNAYDSVGNLVVRIDALGRRTSYVYDVFNNPVAVQNALGFRSTNLYDVQGRPLATQDALGARTSMNYDAVGRFVSTLSPLGFLTSTVYDVVGRPAASVDALGAISTTVYDLANRPVASLDPLGRFTTTIYDVRNRPLATLDALGYLTTTVYDADGRMAASIDALGYRTTTLYDGAGRMVATQDALGRLSTQLYDANGRMLARVDALGQRSTMVYDGAGQVLAVVDALGYRSSQVYDALGRSIASLDPLGYASSTSYDALGNPTAMMNARGYVTTLSCDVLNRVQATTLPQGQITTALYDALGRPRATVDALGQMTTSVYDVAGQLLASQNELGYLTTLLYDAVGQQLARVDANGHRTSMLYDIAGQLQAQQDARGFLTSFVYDALSRTVALVDANGHRTSTAYDPRGLVSAVTDALGVAVESNSYDAVGNLRVSVDGRGWPTTTSYDALDRPLAMAYANGQRLTYAYDAVGQITTMLDWTGPTLSSYDGAGQLSSVSVPLGGVPMTVTYGYWPDGLRAAMYYPDAWGSAPEGLGYAYTPNGYQGQMYPTQTSGGWLYPGCDDLGRLTFFSTSITGFGNTRNTFYDAAGQVTSALVLDSNPPNYAPLVRFTATYDPAGNKLSQLELDGSVTSYAYDASYQLVSEVRSGTGAYAITYLYDALGNRLSQNVDGQLTTYSYGAANQLLGQVNPDASLTTYLYDGNGNRTGEVSALGTTSYTWDGENRLLSVQEPSGTTSYTYGGDGLRRSTSDASGTKLFLWDGQNLLLEKDTSLVTQSLYLGVPDTYQSLLLMRQGSDWFFPAFDTQGSVRDLIAANDVLSDSYRYSAYGLLLAASGSTYNPRRYLGQWEYYAEALNRYRAGARVVETVNGLWLSRDPLGFDSGDWNFYPYVKNNPATWVDPTGLASVRRKSGESSGACFWRIYGEIQKKSTINGYSPLKACDVANVKCSSHISCGPCGPYRAKQYNGGCNYSNIFEYAQYLRGEESFSGPDKVCGGYNGSDKLAHCWAACQATSCGITWGLGCIGGSLVMGGISVHDLINEPDMDDREAEGRGKACATAGSGCLKCCALSVNQLATF